MCASIYELQLEPNVDMNRSRAQKSGTKFFILPHEDDGCIDDGTPNHGAALWPSDDLQAADETAGAVAAMQCPASA